MLALAPVLILTLTAAGVTSAKGSQPENWPEVCLPYKLKKEQSKEINTLLLLFYEIEIWKALELYGLSRQLFYGDVTGRRPGKIEPKLKWNAWKTFEGFTRDEAAQEFENVVRKVLEQQGHSWDDSTEDLPVISYDHCVATQMSTGKTLM